MKKHMKKTRLYSAVKLSTAIMGAALTFNAFAEAHTHHHEEHAHEHHEHHGKHEHGVADMDIALDNGQLLIQMRSPTANFIGFEHEPSTKSQKKAYKKMAKMLNTPKKIIDLEGGKCKVTDKDIDLPFSDDEHHEHDHHEHEHAHHDEHEHHEHDEAHEHEHHEHEHDHDEAHEHKHAHSDIEFKYMFTCKKPADLEHIHVELFERFNGFEKINVQWIAHNKQGHATLTPKSPVVALDEH